MKSKMMVCVMAAVMMIFSVPAWAGQGQGPGKECPMMEGHHKAKGFGPMGMLKKLNLTPEQQTKVDAIMDQNKEALKALNDKINASRQTLHEAIHSDVFDEQKIREASKSMAADKEEMDVLRGKMFAEIKSVLTPDQVSQLKDMKKMHQEQRKCGEKCRFMFEE